MDISEYKYDIIEAILQIRELEGEALTISIPVPVPEFEFIRYKKYPYSKPLYTYIPTNDCKERREKMDDIYIKRIIKYLSEDSIDLRSYYEDDEWGIV